MLKARASREPRSLGWSPPLLVLQAKTFKVADGRGGLTWNQGSSIFCRMT
jgi:hypothetical protein